MRPRPATWAALLVSAAPVHAAVGGEVCVRETAFPKECSFLAHAAGDPSTNQYPGISLPGFRPEDLDSQAFTHSDCGSGRRKSSFLGRTI